MANIPPVLPPLLPIATTPIVVGQQQHPPLLPQLPAGTILQGMVSGQDANGNILIKTEAFRLVLRTHYPLSKGAQVAIHVDQTIAASIDKNALPPVRIVSIDGKTPLPVPLSQPLAQNPQTELAKPVGVLLDIVSRPATALPKAASDAPPTAQLPPAPTHITARGVAAEVNLSEGVRTTAVLLRPAASPQATALLTQLTQFVAPTPQTVALPPAIALRPGLQLQVQMVQTSAPPVATANFVPPPVNTSTIAPVNTPVPASAIVPSAIPQAPQQPTQQPLQPETQQQLPAAPLPQAQMRSGYASYARQAPAMMPASSMPALMVSPTVTPTQTGSTAIPTVPTQATPPAATHVMPTLSPPPTPIAVPPSLTPHVVGQLLSQAEAQILPQGQMAAVVMGKEPGGALIVQTRLGMFTLPQLQADAVQPQPGSVLTWQVRAVQPPQITEQPLPISGSAGLLATATQFTAEWSALNELTTVLQSMQGAMAAQTLQRIIPHVGSNLGAGLLFFMNILRKGDVFEWLGRDLTDKLEKMGKGDLVQRLGNDLAAVRSLFADQPAGNWQAMFFPVMVDKELHHAQMFMKQETEDKKKGGSGTRFIVELDLSNLGPMQIDGFIKKRENSTQFDLVMRSMAELPDDIKTDIYGIFDTAQKVANFNGSLHFRVVTEFTVLPLEEMGKESGKDGSSIMA